jgi:hypothetical protein
MRIVLLAPPNNVEEYYTASLQEYLKHDGCLLISDDPNLVEIADPFELMGKPVWRHLAEVPRAAG